LALSPVGFRIDTVIGRSDPAPQPRVTDSSTVVEKAGPCPNRASRVREKDQGPALDATLEISVI